MMDPPQDMDEWSLASFAWAASCTTIKQQWSKSKHIVFTTEISLIKNSNEVQHKAQEQYELKLKDAFNNKGVLKNQSEMKNDFTYF